jgi:hypothetical protein
MKRNSIAPQHRTIRPRHAAHIVAALFAIVGTAACAPERTVRSSTNTETHTQETRKDQRPSHQMMKNTEACRTLSQLA